MPNPVPLVLGLNSAQAPKANQNASALSVGKSQASDFNQVMGSVQGRPSRPIQATESQKLELVEGQGPAINPGAALVSSNASRQNSAEQGQTFAVAWGADEAMMMDSVSVEHALADWMQAAESQSGLFSPAALTVPVMVPEGEYAAELQALELTHSTALAKGTGPSSWSSLSTGAVTTQSPLLSPEDLSGFLQAWSGGNLTPSGQKGTSDGARANLNSLWARQSAGTPLSLPRLSDSLNALPSGAERDALIAGFAQVLGVTPEALSSMLQGPGVGSLAAAMAHASNESPGSLAQPLTAQAPIAAALSEPQGQHAYFDLLQSQQWSESQKNGEFGAALEDVLSEALKTLEGGDSSGTEKTAPSASMLTSASSKQSEQVLKPYTTSLPQFVQDDAWVDSMGEKILWLGARKIQLAEIHLNPAELGPMEVKVKVQNEQTTISFTVQNATVRELLESNVHRLRDMLSSNGVVLDDVHVGGGDSGTSQEFAENAEGNSRQANQGALGAEAGNMELGLEPVAASSPASVNLVDYYA